MTLEAHKSKFKSEQTLRSLENPDLHVIVLQHLNSMHSLSELKILIRPSSNKHTNEVSLIFLKLLGSF
jgi:hypothetical protein